jgi:RTX calcium-binding nonapeptide repeat (4 copies)
MIRTLALCLGTVLALAPAALAATVSGNLVHCTGGEECRYFMVPSLSVGFEAAPGEVNELRVQETVQEGTLPRVLVHDARAAVIAGDYCMSVNEHEAVCGPRHQEPTSGLAMTAWTGDGADVAFVEFGSALLGPGDDTGRGSGLIRGGPGDDDIQFEPPDPHPFQTFFSISFLGGPGGDLLVGGLPVSDLDGGRGPDELVGGAGPDRLRGRGGDDRITGGRGGDGIAGGRGSDDVFGGADDDRIAVNDGARDLVRCGRGRDRVRVDSLDVARGCERVILERRG